jgi:hypothetical protein
MTTMFKATMFKAKRTLHSVCSRLAIGNSTYHCMALHGVAIWVKWIYCTNIPGRFESVQAMRWAMVQYQAVLEARLLS